MSRMSRRRMAAWAHRSNEGFHMPGFLIARRVLDISLRYIMLCGAFITSLGFTASLWDKKQVRAAILLH